MSVDRVRMKELFAEAIALEPNEQSAFLQQACGADQELYDEVSSLLGFHDEQDLLAQAPREPEDAAEALADPLGIEGLVVDERYRVDRFVAEGGFGYVYRGQHLRFDEAIALKIFKPFGDDENVRRHLEEAFKKEGALLNRLSRKCAAIAQCYDAGQWTLPGRDALLFTVLEWIDGLPLHEVEDPEGGWEINDLTNFLTPVADALCVAHQGGVAHRDIKPANILVTQEGELKLVDFGIAKVASERSKGFLTTGGPVSAFTVEYAAPEQLTGDPTGPWTDVYALATVVIELLSGKNPYRGMSAMKAMLILCDPTDRPTPRAMGVEVDDAVEAVFARALAIEREARYPNAAEFWSALISSLG